MSNTFIFNAYSTGTNFFHNQLNIMGNILLGACHFTHMVRTSSHGAALSI